MQSQPVQQLADYLSSFSDNITASADLCSSISGCCSTHYMTVRVLLCKAVPARVHLAGTVDPACHYCGVAVIALPFCELYEQLGNRATLLAALSAASVIAPMHSCPYSSARLHQYSSSSTSSHMHRRIHLYMSSTCCRCSTASRQLCLTAGVGNGSSCCICSTKLLLLQLPLYHTSS
jgi:hypothetical protein